MYAFHHNLMRDCSVLEWVVAPLNCPQQYESDPHAVLVGGRGYLSLWYGTPESLVLLTSCDRVQITHHRHSVQNSN